MAFLDGNVIAADSTVDKFYLHSGFSSSITTSFSSVGSVPWGVTSDGTNLLTSDTAALLMYKHTGFSSTVTATFAIETSGEPRGITWDGTDSYALTALDPVTQIEQFTGFSSSSLGTINPANGDTTGLTMDGTDFYYGDNTANKYFKLTGFTNTVDSSFASPGNNPQGCGWDGSNLLSANATAGTRKHYKHSGFTTTISDSYASPSTVPNGIEWDDLNTRIGAVVTTRRRVIIG